MRYKTQYRVNTQHHYRGYTTDEQLYKQLVHQLVNDMPVDALKTLFPLTKIDPTSEESRNVISLGKDLHLINFIKTLSFNDEIHFEIEVDTNER